MDGKGKVTFEKKERDMPWEIGDKVIDEDGTVGIVSIFYSDGDIVSYENDAAHPNPRPLADAWDKTFENIHKRRKP